jgi:hypothetical protein
VAVETGEAELVVAVEDLGGFDVYVLACAQKTEVVWAPDSEELS